MTGPHRFGTNFRGGFDPENFRKAARSVGADLRYWSSMATVATLDPKTGKWNERDPWAIYNASDGVYVDLRLEPLEIPCTAVFPGVQGGKSNIKTKIRPGDLVLVEMPDGDLVGPVITKILDSRSSRQPTSGGTPIFQNDRLLIYETDGKIDILCAGGAEILLEQNGTITVVGDVRLGSAGATEAVPLGDVQKTALDALADAIGAFAGSLAGTFLVTNPPGAAAALATLQAAILLFQQTPTLSSKVKTI